MLFHLKKQLHLSCSTSPHSPKSPTQHEMQERLASDMAAILPEESEATTSAVVDGEQSEPQTTTNDGSCHGALLESDPQYVPISTNVLCSANNHNSNSEGNPNTDDSGLTNSDTLSLPSSRAVANSHLEKFTLFPMLPTEVCLMIWQFAFEGLPGRVIVIDPYFHWLANDTQKVSSLALTNKEMYAIFKEETGKRQDFYPDDYPERVRDVRIDHFKDILLYSMELLMPEHQLQMRPEVASKVRYLAYILPNRRPGPPTVFLFPVDPVQHIVHSQITFPYLEKLYLLAQDNALVEECREDHDLQDPRLLDLYAGIGKFSIIEPEKPESEELRKVLHNFSRHNDVLQDHELIKPNELTFHFGLLRESDDRL
jgi:hypothetical protein